MHGFRGSLLIMFLIGLALSACQPIQAPTVQISSTPTSLPTPVLAPATAPAPVADLRVEMKAEKIVSQALAGNLLGDSAERTVYVLLPPSYATSEERYPVVYVMPWGVGDPAENAWSFMGAMRSLLRKGEIDEMILVVPNGATSLGASHFRSSPTIGDYETYISQEVVDYVDTHYRTLPARDSRGLAGCSNGGSASMRLGFKYPNVFSVVAPTGGIYDEALEVRPSDVEAVHLMKELPRAVSDLEFLGMTGWYVQLAAAHASDPDNPPFYCEMPFRIANGQGEFVPEVIAKIVENDAAHEARQYVQQPSLLRGIFIQHGLYDDTDVTNSVNSFLKLLTELGIEHEYVEEKAFHCGHPWEAASLKFMSDNLSFEQE